MCAGVSGHLSEMGRSSPEEHVAPARPLTSPHSQPGGRRLLQTCRNKTTVLMEMLLTGFIFSWSWGWWSIFMWATTMKISVYLMSDLWLSLSGLAAVKGTVSSTRNAISIPHSPVEMNTKISKLNMKKYSKQMIFNCFKTKAAYQEKVKTCCGSLSLAGGWMSKFMSPVHFWSFIVWGQGQEVCPGCCFRCQELLRPPPTLVTNRLRWHFSSLSTEAVKQT